MPPTVQLNATGRYTLTNVLDDDDDLREKILDHKIMEPIEFTKPELERLVTITDRDNIRGGVHWMNTRLRITRAYRETNQ